MSSENKTNAPTPSPELTLVCGSGGSRAILGSAGAILASNFAGITEWQTLGGVSGGSIPTLMLASGMDPRLIVRYTIETDFSSLLSRKASLKRILLAYLMKDRYEKTRPRRGVFGSEEVGRFVESFVPTWPKNYWTAATVGNNQWLFTADGVFEYTAGGGCRRLSSDPAPVGIAIRATCAVPGIIDAVYYNHRYLFDGALSRDGRCPVRIPKRHFGAKPESIVACDVGEDESKSSRRTRFLWKILCGGNCVPPPVEQPLEAEGVIVIKPAAMNFRSLQFKLTLEQKWQAVMSGFQGAVTGLQGAGLLTGDRSRQSGDIVQAFAEIQAASVTPGELAERTQKLLAANGLY